MVFFVFFLRIERDKLGGRGRRRDCGQHGESAAESDGEKLSLYILLVSFSRRCETMMPLFENPRQGY